MAFIYAFPVVDDCRRNEYAYNIVLQFQVIFARKGKRTKSDLQLASDDVREQSDLPKTTARPQQGRRRYEGPKTGEHRVYVQTHKYSYARFAFVFLHVSLTVSLPVLQLNDDVTNDVTT